MGYPKKHRGRRKIGSKNCSIIFTGQHYDNQIGLGFMRELDLPKPNYSMLVFSF